MFKWNESYFYYIFFLRGKWNKRSFYVCFRVCNNFMNVTLCTLKEMIYFNWLNYNLQQSENVCLSLLFWSLSQSRPVHAKQEQVGR